MTEQPEIISVLQSNLSKARLQNVNGEIFVRITLNNGGIRESSIEMSEKIIVNGKKHNK